MKYILFSILLFTATANFAQDNYQAELIPASLRSRANATIRTEEVIVDMQAPNEVNLSVKKAITVLNKNGDYAAQLVLFYDKNTVIRSIKGEIYDEFGKLDSKITQSSFKDESAVQGFSLFEDSRVKHFLPAIYTYPYTIVYQYEIKFKQNLIIPDWRPKQAPDISIEKSTYTFVSKLSDQYRINAKNYSGTPIETINEKEKRKILTWKVENLPGVKPEPYSPNPAHFLTSVKIAPQQFSYFNYKGAYNNWAELGKWSYDNLLKGRDILPPATIQTIQELVKNEASDKAKAKKIYEFLQSKTRYISVQVGIGGFQPAAAVDVDRLGYGDCKGLVNYMYSLLKAVGIESYYCVVEGDTEKISLDPSYASMNQGNHIILCMPLKGDTTWLECTNQQIPFGYLGKFTDDRYALACTAEGGKLLRTPKFPVEKNRQVRHAQMQLSVQGDIKGKLETVFSGLQYNNHEHLVGKPIIEQQKLLKEVYDVDNINFDSVTYHQQKDINPILTEILDFKIRHYGSLNDDRMFLQVNAFNIQGNIPEIKNRTLPVYINRGFTDEDTVIYDLPAQLQLLTALENKQFKNEFGTYEATSKLEGNKLIYKRKIILNEGTFPASSYATFSKFISDVNAADHLKLVFSLKK
jgi:transglutaminase-like putative cysteine protease